MKSFYVLCSIPAAVAFWFGAQASGPGPQEPSDSGTSVTETREFVFTTQEDGDDGQQHIRARAVVQSADEPAVFAFGTQEPAVVVQTVPAVPPVPGAPMVAGVAAAPLAPAHGTFTMKVGGPGGDHLLMGDDETRKAYEALKKAKTEEDEDAAREAVETLRDALSEQYDKYLERQQEELEKLAKKLNELETQFEKRREAKEDLVELKLKTLENQAAGLGWPTGGPEGDHMMWRSATGGALGGAMGGPGHRFEVHGVQGHPIAPRALEHRHVVPDGRAIIIERRSQSEKADASGAEDESDENDESDSEDESESASDSDENDDQPRDRIRRRRQ